MCDLTFNLSSHSRGYVSRWQRGVSAGIATGGCDDALSLFDSVLDLVIVAYRYYLVAGSRLEIIGRTPENVCCTTGNPSTPYSIASATKIREASNFNQHPTSTT